MRSRVFASAAKADVGVSVSEFSVLPVSATREGVTALERDSVMALELPRCPEYAPADPAEPDPEAAVVAAEPPAPTKDSIGGGKITCLSVDSEALRFWRVSPLDSPEAEALEPEFISAGSGRTFPSAGNAVRETTIPPNLEALGGNPGEVSWPETKPPAACSRSGDTSNDGGNVDGLW